MKALTRRAWIGACALAIAGLYTMGGAVQAQDKPPIKVGLAMAQTGPLAGGGKSSLLALQLWRDDVNANGGLLDGRKVELVVYDDQGVPANEPGIYTRLMDVDDVDLLISPYGTNPTAAILQLIKQRDRLMIGNFAFSNNTDIKHDKYFQIAPWGNGTEGWVGAFIYPGVKLGAKTLAILGADTEFSQTLVDGARELAKKEGLEIVFDQSYPATTVDFSSLLRSLKSKKPDLVFVASYPADSAAIVRSVNEIGVGSSVKMIGGGMVGLQYAAMLESLGPLLNGFVNYAHYVPEKTADFPGMKSFLERYTTLATEQKIDPLGYYLAPFGYAMGQVLAQAVEETKSLDDKVLAEYIHSHPIKTVVGDISFTEIGEWVTPRVFETQYQGVVGHNVEQFTQPGKQVIIYPEAYKSGELRVPFEQARK